MKGTRPWLGMPTGLLLVGASFYVLTPQWTHLGGAKEEFLPGFVALSISLGFAFSVAAGYAVAANAGRKSTKRTAILACLSLMANLFLLSLPGRESPQILVTRTVTLLAGVLLGGYLRSPRPPRPVRIVPITDVDLRANVERRMDASNKYIRHMVSNLVNWYTVFFTVNYGSMGWFATQSQKGASPNTIVLVAAMFILQNVLGIVACLRIKRYIVLAADEIAMFEQELSGEVLQPQTREALLPSPVYSRAIQLMALGLVTIILAWVTLSLVLAGIPSPAFLKNAFALSL